MNNSEQNLKSATKKTTNVFKKTMKMESTHTHEESTTQLAIQTFDVNNTHLHYKIKWKENLFE